MRGSWLECVANHHQSHRNVLTMPALAKNEPETGLDALIHNRGTSEVSLTVKAGEILGVIDKPGTGKSIDKSSTILELRRPMSIYAVACCECNQTWNGCPRSPKTKY